MAAVAVQPMGDVSSAVPSQQHQPTLAYTQQSMDPAGVEAAIAAGRVYAPANSSFVPGHLVARAGMTTLYDSNVVPTFESNLEFIAGPRPVATDVVAPASHQPRGISQTTSKRSGAMTSHKKKTCC